MKNISLEICVCPKCVMNGAMELMDSILSIKKMKNIKNKFNLSITTTPCLSDCSHHGTHPVVVLNGTLIEDTRENEIMSRILNLIVAEG